MPEKLDKITFDTRDEYQRKPIAEKIIRLLASGSKVSPMVIDGGWGTGKTEFCYKLMNLIKYGDSNFQPVYVDAFSADHADEPLMTLLASILKLLPEKDRPSLIQKALPAVRFGIKTSLKAGVSWVLKQDAADIADDFDKDLKKAGDDAINYALESQLSDHVAAEESIESLKSALKELAKDMNVVVFVDELDRCRPTFSISMLESIKHVFDVEGVQFVLITNSTQLKASINHCYGASIDAQRYLDKFLGFSFSLPQSFRPNGHTSELASVAHLESLIGSSHVLSDSGLVHGGVIDFLKTIVEKNNLSLREVETFVRYLEIYHTLADNGGFPDKIIFGYALLRIIGVFMFCFESSEADKLVDGFVDAPFMANLMGKSQLVDRQVTYPDLEDTLTALIGFETSTDKSSFTPKSEEDMTFWKQSISGLFQGSGGYGKRTEIISYAIETLKLAR